MGCNNAKGTAEKPATGPENLYLESPQRSKESKGRSPGKDASDFKFSHSDLVSEKFCDINKDYDLLLPPIGKGAFGEVRKGVHRLLKVTRAVKIINKESCSLEEQNLLVNEVNILKKLDHPNIMKIYEFYQDDRNFYIVSEFYAGGELFEKITQLKYFSERKAALAMKEILSAVFYLHQNNIVHRDLKPENVLYESKKEDAHLKVIDFGTSKEFKRSKKMNQQFGTPYYIAPEVIKGNYTEKCDIWSCGVILYIMLCGYPPFNGRNDRVILDKVAAGKYAFDTDEWKPISEDAKNFIRKLLEYDPKKRISAEQAFKDPWIIQMVGNEDVDRPLAIQALSNLRTFCADQKLQAATWAFLVNYLATKEEKNELLKTFQALDTNGDGQITREELIEGYKKIMDSATAERDVEAIMTSIDQNCNGAIDYSEFVAATINREKILSKERLEAAFKMFDQDGNGFLTADELKTAFSGGKDVNDEIWTALIKEVDDNSDGKISYKEFKDMMLRIVK